MTNAEKLRQTVPTMSDEELLRIIFDRRFCTGSRCTFDMECDDCARNWLNSEAK